jgi:hypothetical protein
MSARIVRGKYNWLIYRNPSGGCRVLPILVSVGPEDALAQAKVLYPDLEIVSDEPASEGYFGKS